MRHKRTIILYKIVDAFRTTHRPINKPKASIPVFSNLLQLEIECTKLKHMAPCISNHIFQMRKTLILDLFGVDDQLKVTLQKNLIEPLISC